MIFKKKESNNYKTIDCNTETENALYFASIKAVPLIAERHFQGYRSKKTYLR